MAKKTDGPYIDTDILIRFLTSDDPVKQKAATRLFEEIEQEKSSIYAPDTVIADTVYVLSSPKLYHLPKNQIRDMLVTILKLSNFKVDNKHALIVALDFYAANNIDFGDALLAALTLQSKPKLIYSYDRDFEKIPGVKRVEP